MIVCNASNHYAVQKVLLQDKRDGMESTAQKTPIFNQESDVDR
jgi:hypothetical protein